MDHVCTDCGRDESVVKFRLRDSGNLGSMCEGCRSLRQSAQRNGITVNEYHRLFKKQNGCCAICGIRSENVNHAVHKRLVIDHDHVSGKVRGLLCHSCNCGLGLMQDSTKLLARAISYLSKLN